MRGLLPGQSAAFTVKKLTESMRAVEDICSSEGFKAACLSCSAVLMGGRPGGALVGATAPPLHQQWVALPRPEVAFYFEVHRTLFGMHLYLNSTLPEAWQQALKVARAADDNGQNAGEEEEEREETAAALRVTLYSLKRVAGWTALMLTGQNLKHPTRGSQPVRAVRALAAALVDPNGGEAIVLYQDPAMADKAAKRVAVLDVVLEFFKVILVVRYCDEAGN